MASAGGDTSKAIDNDFYLGLVGLFHHFLEAFISTEHFICSISTSDSKWCCIRALVLHLALSLVKVRIVVTLKGSHDIESSDSSFLVLVDSLLNFGEIPTFNEFSFFCIDFCVLVVDLNLVEDLIANALSMYDKSALCK